MPLAVLAAGGCDKWIQLHDAASKQDTRVIHQFTSTTFPGEKKSCSCLSNISNAENVRAPTGLQENSAKLAHEC